MLLEYHKYIDCSVARVPFEKGWRHTTETWQILAVTEPTELPTVQMVAIVEVVQIAAQRSL